LDEEGPLNNTTPAIVAIAVTELLVGVEMADAADGPTSRLL
jgi:hypothetical protein